MEQNLMYGVISIMAAQFVALVCGIGLYFRQRNAVDIEKADRSRFGVKVEEAMRIAHEAKDMATRIDIEQYQTLSRKVVETRGELDSVRLKQLAIEESLKAINMKLTSRSRAEKKAEEQDELDARIRAEGSMPEDKSGFVKEPSNLDELIRSGVAKPLFEQVSMPLDTPKYGRPGFGQKLGG